MKEMTTDALELYCRNLSKAKNGLTVYDRELLMDVSTRLCDLQSRIAEDDKAREEGRFKPGCTVRVIERDECGEAVEITGYMFLATVGRGAILSDFINGVDGLEDTIGDHIVETAENMHTDLYVFPVEDVYLTRQEAAAALDGGGEDG